VDAAIKASFEEANQKKDQAKEKDDTDMDIDDGGREEDEGEEDDEVAVQYSADVEKKMAALVDLRDKLVDILSTWMNTADTDDDIEDREMDPVERDLQKYAFWLTGDLRLIFGLLHQNKFAGGMSWVPAQDFMTGMRHTFEKEGEAVKAKYDALVGHGGGDERAVSNEVAEMMRDVFFLPLAKFTLCMRTEDVNRRQAGAAVTYLMHHSKVLRDACKQWVKQFKHKHGMVKFLEVQLVALKTYYTDNCVAHLLDVDGAVEEGTQEALEDAADAGCERSIMLATKLQQSGGVGKLKEHDDVTALVNFLCTGVDFSFVTPMQAGFCEVLMPMVRILPASEKRTVLDYLQSRLDETRDYEDLDRDSREWFAVKEFKKKLTKDGELGENRVAPTPRRRSPKGRGSSGKTKKVNNLERDLSQVVDSESEDEGEGGETYASFMAQERERDMSLGARGSMMEQSAILMEQDDEEREPIDEFSQEEAPARPQRSSIVMALDLESVHAADESGSDAEAFDAPQRRRR